MFDIGFSELVLVFIIGLVVLGPKRLPVAVRTVVGWIRAMRSLATNVQNELVNELKLQELQDSLKKVEQASMDSLSPELKASVEELKQTAASLKSVSLSDNSKHADEEAQTIHRPQAKTTDARPQVDNTVQQSETVSAAAAEMPERSVLLQKNAEPVSSLAASSPQPSDER